MEKTCILILDNLRSVENTASIFRTAEALGVKKIFCLGTTPTPLDRFGRKRADFTKVSLGAEAIEWAHSHKITEVTQGLKKGGYKVVALEQHPNSKNLGAVSHKLLVLVVGNEVDGVSKEALDAADEVVEIPLLGHKESLNVSVATGIALYELLK